MRIPAGGIIVAAVMLCAGAVALPAGARSSAAVRATGLPAAPPGSVPTDPGRRVDRQLDRTIIDEQVDLVARTAEDRVTAAVGTLRDARLQLSEATSQVGSDRTSVAAARALERRTQSATAAANTADDDAQAARTRAVATLARNVRTLRGLAVGLYIAGPAQPVNLGPADRLQSVEDDAQLLAVVKSAEIDHDDAERAAATAATRLVVANARLHRAFLAEGAATTSLGGVEASLADEQLEVGTLGPALSRDEAQLRSAERIRAGAEAAFEGPERSSAPPVPTILGRPALTAGQLASWYHEAGYEALTRTSIERLAYLYIREGDAEGVRGDIAFAQAMVETGGFTSPDAVGLNNYAGIGHCDSCDSGLHFPSARAGVLGQIELLRTYADAGLTVADLGGPPVLPSLAPQDQSARGCCQTWNSLTGIWATDPDYGLTVLDMYQSILSLTLAE